jgi:hypothetical protein
VLRVKDPYGRILGFLDRSRYHFLQVAPQLYSYPVRCFRVTPGVRLPQVEDHCTRLSDAATKKETVIS